jgi:hypothetical protein
MQTGLRLPWNRVKVTALLETLHEETKSLDHHRCHGQDQDERAARDNQEGDVMANK